MMQYRLMALMPSLLTMALAWGQSSAQESSCDTAVFGHHYSRCIKDVDARYVEFGNRNDQGQRHGWWCELKGDSASSNVTEYHKGLRVNLEWHRGCVWRIDEQGTILSKGKADRRAKKAF